VGQSSDVGSANGAKCKSLGQRPRSRFVYSDGALKARNGCTRDVNEYGCRGLRNADLRDRFIPRLRRFTHLN
jgi:hypothetical protein